MLHDSTRRSARRSRKRDDGLVAFLVRPRMTLHELAGVLRIPPYRAWELLYGDGREYAFQHAWVRLGLVRPVVGSAGLEFEATDAGLEQARALRDAHAAGRLI